MSKKWVFLARNGMPVYGEELGHEPSVLRARWPEVDERALERNEVEVVLQVNGKVRGRITVPAGMENAALEATVLDNEQVKKHIAGKTVR